MGQQYRAVKNGGRELKHYLKEMEISEDKDHWTSLIHIKLYLFPPVLVFIGALDKRRNYADDRHLSVINMKKKAVTLLLQFPPVTVAAKTPFPGGQDSREAPALT